MAELTGPQAPLTFLRSQLSSLGKSTLFLLNILNRLDTSNSPASNLDSVIGNFQNSLLLLSSHIFSTPTHRWGAIEREWYNTTSILPVLGIALHCLKQLDNILSNSVNSEFSSLRRYLQAGDLEDEMKCLKSMAAVYGEVLKAPVMGAAVHATREELGTSFREMSEKAIETWLAHLEHLVSELEEDEATLVGSSKASLKTKVTTSLDPELIEHRTHLIQIARAMIENASNRLNQRNDRLSILTLDPGVSSLIELVNFRPSAASTPSPMSPLPPNVRSPYELSQIVSVTHGHTTIQSDVGAFPLSPDIPDLPELAPAEPPPPSRVAIERIYTGTSKTTTLADGSDTEVESPEFFVEPSYEYLHMGPETLFRNSEKQM